MNKYRFVFDEIKCVGCEACIVACANENNSGINTKFRNIYKSNEGKIPNLSLFNLSLACSHCDEHPCLKNCPTSAYFKDENSNIVLHNEENCIGCKYCTWICPFNAPVFNKIKGKVSKCSMCFEKIEKGEKPACASLCPTGALSFEKINENEINENSNIKPNIKIIEKKVKNGPIMDLSLFEGIKFENQEVTEKIDGKKELPLILFTLLTSFVFGVYVSDFISPMETNVKLFLNLINIIGGLISFFHLGSKVKSYKAFSNFKNSWLSREIIFYSLFTLSLILNYLNIEYSLYLCTFFGILLIFSIDNVYKKPFSHCKQNSSLAFFVAIHTFLLNSNFIFGVIIITLLRILLYVKEYKLKNTKATSTNVLRICLMIVSSYMYFIHYPKFIIYFVFLIGELIGRYQFYNNLYFKNIIKEIKTHATKM